MKYINKILGLLLVALVAVACDPDAENYTPGEKLSTAQVYFPTTMPAQVNLENSANSFDVTLSRISTDEAATVNLKVTNESGLFTVPTSASFAAGAETTTISIGYEPAKLGYDNYQSLTIALADTEDTTPYGNASYTFKAGIPAPWKSIGKATFVEDCMTTFFKVENVAYAVEIQENLEKPGVYRLVNAYGKAYPFNEEGDYDATKDYYIEINAQDPEGVYITLSNTGMAWSDYGEVSIWSLASYYMEKGKTLEEVKAAGYCGTLKDGIITFPVESLLISMANYQNAGFYKANVNGAFKVALPGVVIADYSVEVAYLGRYTDAENNSFAIGNVVLGEDVTSAKVALVQGSDLEAAIAGIIDGSIESTEITESGTLKMSCEESGTYSFVVVSYDGSEAQEAGSATFDFFLGGSAFDELQKDVPIEAYVGSWLVPAKTSSQSGHVLANVTKNDDETLLVKGIIGESGYDDTFSLIYDKETSWVVLVPQDVASFGGSDCILAPMNVDEGKLTTQEYLVGGLTKDGELKFLNSEENAGKWNAFAFFVIGDGGVSVLSPYYDLLWAPYSAEEESVSLSSFTSTMKQFMRVQHPKMSIKKYIGAPFVK